MKTTLITGLDGSGKSSLMSKLASHFTSDKHIIINLPHSELEYFDDKNLNSAALFIDKINTTADIKQIASLKALALICSVLLYKRILKHKASENTQAVYCERHPLIDTAVYATFYASKLNPEFVNADFLNTFETAYKSELEFILKPVSDYLDTKNGQLTGLIAFLYDWFYLKNKNSAEELSTLFSINLPEKIYYLKATPELLFERIKQRNFREAHESVETFKQLDKVYDAVFKEIGTKYPVKIQYINADDTGNLDNLFMKLTGLNP